MSRHTLLKALRTIHLYLGVFITPALIFFAFTGALQTFGLHETNRDHPTYKPAHWIAVLAQLHKKQTTILPNRRPAAAATANPSASTPTTPRPKTPDAPAPTPAQPTPHPFPMRIFFLVVSLGLFTSTLTGLYMTYSYIRNKLLVTFTLAAGIAVPLILVFL